MTNDFPIFMAMIAGAIIITSMLFLTVMAFAFVKGWLIRRRQAESSSDVNHDPHTGR